ncbi:O-methyltransferase-domain-containing protein [Lasiosphaeria ovina]|uniref:O-methyltransferase-domain-containing protein n=1 Tax=Lasiosphaeria ovina TaxID=92902 RepID=A0AAE0N0I1_9PEZI|nr:O-methyltransferase-domain-containing protein [Lasiosphaeria ovina]
MAAAVAAEELHALLMGPVGIILYELWSKSSYMISVDAVSKFKLAHTFPLDTTTTIPQMAVRLPSFRFVVQDLPEGIAEAPKDKNPRVEFQAHDFFTEQPVKGADIFILRQIMHDWSDKYCRQILQDLIPALKPGARIVLNEQVLPTPNTVSKYQERIQRHLDLLMWRLFNGKERDEDDWRSLVERTDRRFKVTQTIRAQGSDLQIIEVTWQG